MWSEGLKFVVRESDDHPEFVAKGPSSEDDEASNWPAFRYEAKMQRLFSKDTMIRHMVDFAPETDTTRPMMILEPFQKTLWDARTTRPLSTHEIQWIMQGVLIGLLNIHRKRLVFTDLKMENVGISGFDNEKPNENPREIKVRLADLGAVSKPGTREISALTYRSPEVQFGKPWDQSTDVWSWGIILAQLLLAQVDFCSPGMYDSIAVGPLDDRAKTARDAIAVDFDLHSLSLYADDAKSRAMLPPARPEMAYKWAEAMMAKGVPGEDIQFLANTLNPLPKARFTTVEILESGYLDF
ncbi:hypothetical protein NEMBOFW57_005080 [Staphylotrichum longicolle]|uniref:cyclin-dependent kinase n=1 Tax=Staphylotrichum longicolle TaxID=669026 RepID=A0AAD4HVR9_9PEZI|nr:hypothetical protein NEMBOFW57_005080 [Staphylotrichum longicolle]